MNSFTNKINKESEKFDRGADWRYEGFTQCKIN
jgi:hypothetical protein